MPASHRVVRLAAVALSLLWAAATTAEILYVDDDAPAPGDGRCWQTAYKHLQDALMMAAPPAEIRVAQGTYRPDEFALSDRPSLGAAEAFHLKNGVAVKGGFVGLGAPNPDARNTAAYVSHLYGRGAYHVVVADETNRTAILDGFLISGGEAWHTNGHLTEGSYGGGLYCRQGAPTIRDCTFTNNSALAFGGGMYSEAGNPLIEDCRFFDNSATDGGGLDVDYGGAVVQGCMFSGNRACSYNADGGSGGAVYCYQSQCRIDRCTIVGNGVDEWGHVAGVTASGGEVRISNCILWNNRDHDTGQWKPQLYVYGPAAPEYSCIEGEFGAYGGPGNTDSDPLFADPGRWVLARADEEETEPAGYLWQPGEYHLKSQAGRWEPASASWVIDDATSPCIDAGDPMSPIGHEPFPNGGRVNMGAYGGTAQASKSYFGGPVCETIVAGDINGDCKVDFLDFQIMGLHWLETSQ